MRRILVVHPFSPDRMGGAEQSLRWHLDNAPQRVRVDVASPDAKVKLKRYDGVVLGNLRPHGGHGFESEVAWLLRWASQLADYQGFSLRSERDVHPCTYRDGRCFAGRRLRKRKCDCSMSVRDANELLVNACSAIQFLSPAHRDLINQLITVRVPQHVIGAPIDFQLFRPATPFDRRPNRALILGDAIRVAPTAIRRARRAGYEVEQVEYLSVDYQDMPTLYNRFRAVVVDPVMFHAFGRIAVEAMACGCRILASERVGAMSFDDPLQASREANDLFWQVLLDGCDARGPTRPSRIAMPNWLRRAAA